MKKTRITTAVIVALALTVLAGEALAGPGGGRGRGGGPGWQDDRVGGPGRGRGMAGGPRIGANLDPAQQDDSWVPGPYCPWGQGPNQNIQGWQGPGPYCPFGRGPNQNIQGRQRPGQGGFGQNFQGPRGPYCPYGQGFRRWNMMITQRGQMDVRGSGGPTMRGRGDSAFQRRDIAAQGWGMNNRPGRPRLGDIGRQGPGMQPRWFAPADTDQMNQQIPTGSRGWAPRLWQGWRQGRASGWGRGWEPNLQPEKAPDINAPVEPVIEDQPEKPQGE